MYWTRKRLFTIRQWQEKKEKKKTRNKKQNHEKLKQHKELRIRLRRGIFHQKGPNWSLGHWAAFLRLVVVLMMRLARGARPADRKTRFGHLLSQLG